MLVAVAASVPFALVPGAGAASCTFMGTPGNDVIMGSNGADVICGFGGDDTLSGAGGRDVLIGGSGHDVLDGQEGNDKLVGGAGNDRMAGGPGADVVSFRSSKSAVRINLQRRQADGEGHDIIAGVSSVIGSRFEDRLTGSKAPESFKGLGGRGHAQRSRRSRRPGGRDRRRQVVGSRRSTGQGSRRRWPRQCAHRLQGLRQVLRSCRKSVRHRLSLIRVKCCLASGDDQWGG